MSTALENVPPPPPAVGADAGAAGVSVPVAVRRSDLALAIAAAVVVIGAGFVMGFRVHATVADAGATASAPGLEGSFLAILGAILAQNLGAMLLAYSGAVTFGLTTVASVFFTGAFVGATFEAVSSSLGVAETLTLVAPYILFEVGGLLVAAGAGLLPVLAFVRSRFRDGPRASYLSALASSLRLLLLAAASVVLGAVIETVLIVGRS